MTTTQLYWHHEIRRAARNLRRVQTWDGKRRWARRAALCRTMFDLCSGGF